MGSTSTPNTAVAVAAKRKCPDAAPMSNIVPIRVDVLSADKTIRIVDTLLFDPTCWPVTLYQPLYAAIEENVTDMAHNILSDAEVQGMGRTVRHFTGRVDLWSAKLQKSVEDQLRPQLWKIATMDPETLFNTNKRDKSSSYLVPISIRLMVDRIMIHEDIFWDRHNGHLSPFEFAQDMAQELNLPDEATVAIATTIIEQLHGLEIEKTPDPTLANTNTNTNNNNSSTTAASNKNDANSNASSKRKGSRGAWMVDPKEQAAFASQIVAQHRGI